jgi:hypothetical protein
MRKSFVALALLVGAAALWTTLALAQEDGRVSDEGVKLMNARIAKMDMSRASRLGTSMALDTLFVGQSAAAPNSGAPFFVGAGLYRPGASAQANWDFDSYHGGALDSMQGWLPVVIANTRSAGTIPDYQRPWNCLDYGNRLNATPVQGRTPGIIGVWHADGGVNVPATASPLKPTWAPLAGTMSAWCGLRSGTDVSYRDDQARGGTTNPINGDILWGLFWNGTNYTSKLFPGYAGQWDQMLYRDIRVSYMPDSNKITVAFLYETAMSPGTNNLAASCKGWFDKDPLSMTQGGTGPDRDNFISASAYLSGTRNGPIDSFMVYVGVPTDSAAVRYTDSPTKRKMYDLKRRWFSEVIAIDKPYKEILSTYGDDAVYAASPFSVVLDSSHINPMLRAQHGGVDGDGLLRIVFRSKTNTNFSDETGTGGSYNSGTKGAVRIDNVTVTGLGVATPVSSGFETVGEINNNIEQGGTGVGGTVGRGYALNYWKSTGKPPAEQYAHTHPLYGGDIGGGNVYQPLAWDDLCGSPSSAIRQCNVAGTVISTGLHPSEAAGGASGTPFLENRNGILSPAINLVTPVTGFNNIGLDRAHATSSADWFIIYDQVAFIFDVYTDGNVWGETVASYPAQQANGAVVWGDIIAPSGVWSNGPDHQCYWMTDKFKPLMKTTNPNGFPDSLRLYLFREQRCISWGVTLGCSPTNGHYFDNIALILPPPLIGAADKVNVDIWDWYNDAFPANETAGLPGSGVPFDTCGAHIMTARNMAANTGNTLRFDVPGDSIFIKAQNPEVMALSLDVVFRIFPGPGNYMTVGNKATALRKIPQAAVAAVPGDNSFWGQYLANNGAFGSPGGHGGTWSVDKWNSARIDSVEWNMFPVNGRTGNLSGLSPDQWMSTLHEDDPHFGVLGILKNRCFLVDTAGAIDNSNITCSSVPGWLTTVPQSRTGYNGQQQTREYTKVFPDGLLTPGSHVEYFLRMSRIATPTSFVMTPDTNRITPQPTGSANNFDAQRWEGFGILPDRWKDAGYGGLGSACMLVVDGNDRRGDEKVWVGAADSIGATVAAKYGAHNGWHATAAYIASDGTHDFTSETNLGGNPAIAVWKHGGNPGTIWDFYQIKAAESSNTGSAMIGSRLANRAGMGLLTGKEDRHGPTPEMMRTYYKMMFYFSGDLNSSVLGPITDRGPNDVGLIQDFLAFGANMNSPRGFWGMGHGFVESLDGEGPGSPQVNFMTNYLALSLRDPSYFALSGTSVRFTDLIPSSVVTTSGRIYCAENACTFTNDVMLVNSGIAGATPSSWYQNLGTNGPYISGVYAPSGATHPYVTLTDGWDMWNMFSRYGGNTVGRLQYFMDVLVNVFGSICPWTPQPTIDVPQNTARTVNVDFLGNVWGNPMVAGGKAIVRFGLAKADRVEVKVYDVTGRLVKTLADRNFQAGEQSLTWDGSNDQGQVVPRGVYFTQVKFINSRFVDAKKVTVLK